MGARSRSEVPFDAAAVDSFSDGREEPVTEGSPNDGREDGGREDGGREEPVTEGLLIVD